MKSFLFVLSLLLCFSLSLQAQTNKRVNKKAKVSQQRVGKLKQTEKRGLYRDSLPWVKAPGGAIPQVQGVQSNTNESSLPFKGSDEELQAIQSKRGQGNKRNSVQTRGNRQNLKRGKAPGGKMKNGNRSTTKRKKRNN